MHVCARVCVCQYECRVCSSRPVLTLRGLNISKSTTVGNLINRKWVVKSERRRERERESECVREREREVGLFYKKKSN